jgi:hypothetical protein
LKFNLLNKKGDIVKTERAIGKIDKQSSKYQTALETTDDVEIIKILAKNISQSNDKREELLNSLSKMRIEYELLDNKFNQNLQEITYYDVVEKVNDWFFKLNITDQRTELIRTIKKCKTYSHYILIEAGSVVFFFDVYTGWEFDMGLLDELNKDKNFKEHFIEGKGKLQARQFGSYTILRMDLKKGDRRILVFQYLIEKFQISYDLSEVEYFVSFVKMNDVLDYTPINKKLETDKQENKKIESKKPLNKK